MVNETNKPQEILDNEQLGQRLAASNQALLNMQAEHRQLLEEMEQLRKRAEELQRVREQQEVEEEKRRLEYEQNLATATESLEPNKKNENIVENVKMQEENNTVDDPEEADYIKEKLAEIARLKATESLEPNKKNENIVENVKMQEENNTVDDPEEADYIKEKLAEIARLKAQFKRVQHIINTTELIDNHINKSQATEKQLQKVVTETENIKCEITSTTPVSGLAVTDPVLLVMPNMPSMADVNAATTSDEKEQLILTMVNMFQDFSSDLKSQADNLRAERERIKDLKESIIRSRKEQPK